MMNEVQAADRNRQEHTTYAAICDILSESGAGESLAPDYCFFEDESLDSFTRINLLMELESAFSVSLSATELLEEPHRTLAGLAALIADRSR